MIGRRDFNKLVATAGVGALLGSEARAGQSPEVKKPTTKERVKLPELRSSMSQEEGEKELLAMAKLGGTKLKRTAFLKTPESGRWLIVDDQDNTQALLRSVANSSVDAKQDITIYRIGVDSMEPYVAPNAPPLPKPVEDISKLLPIERLMRFLPNEALYADAGKDWSKSELLNVLYIGHKLKKASVSGKISTPYGFITFKIQENTDHWAAFINAFDEADTIVSYLASEYPDTLGRQIVAATKNAGPDTLNIVRDFLDKRILEMDSLRKDKLKVSPDGNIDFDEGLYNLLLTQYAAAEKEHKKLIHTERTADGQTLSMGYGEVKDQVGMAKMEVEDQAKDRKPAQTLKEIQRAYDMLGVSLEFELKEDLEKK